MTLSTGDLAGTGASDSGFTERWYGINVGNGHLRRRNQKPRIYLGDRRENTRPVPKCKITWNYSNPRYQPAFDDAYD